MKLYEIIHGTNRKPIKEERATWVIGYERDGKEYSWSTSANSSGEAQGAFRDYMQGQGVGVTDYRIKGTFQSTTNDTMEEGDYDDWVYDDDEPTDKIAQTDDGEFGYDESPDDESEYVEPSDIVISSNGFKYNVGGEDAGHIGEFEELEDAEKAIKDWMAQNKFYPSVWFQDDHGGLQPHTMDEDVNEHSSDSFSDDDLETVKKEAQRISKEEGVVQHVNILQNGSYVVDDWYDTDNTVTSFMSGREEPNNTFSGEWVDQYADDEEDDMNEENTTSNLDGGLGQPQIPGAFQRKNPTTSDKAKERDNATSSTGWNIKAKTNNYIKKRNEILSKAESLIDSINEARYADYAADESMNPKEKINSSIKHVNRKLYEIEHMINHAVKLRTESGLEDVFWKSTRSQFSKISERMLRISTKLREFNK